MAVPLFVLSYVLGCLSPGYLLVRRATGRDLRASHTGSTGARNAGRVAGRGVAAAVFGLDLAKGAAAVAIARLAGLDDTGAAACLLAVVLGHVAPAQLRFRGGRGLSTAVGGLLVLALPKGIIDPGESAAETAVREVWEETGLRCRDLGRLGDVRYVYTRGGRRIFKIVVFHLMRVTGGRIGEIEPEMRREVAAATWIALEDGPARLSYRGEREMVVLAAERVQAG